MLTILIGLFIILVLGAFVSQMWLTEARWKNLIFGVAATITVVILLVWILELLGVWHAPGLPLGYEPSHRGR